MAQERDDERRRTSDEAFPIVAVGGSAGSLTAFQQILGRLPPGTRRRMEREGSAGPELILLAIEDVTGTSRSGS